jgi:carbamate kinase
MIGYLIQQELGNELPFEKRLASLLTLIEVDPDDPAFADPTKPIGPVYAEDDSRRLADEKGWIFKPDGDSFRRVVPSPLPQRIFGLEPVEWLLERGSVVICAGGGGIPVMYTDDPVPAGRRLVGVEAVIDKDLASALLARDLRADALAIVTDVDAVYADWGTPAQRAIRRATPDALAETEFAAGSMAPKVRAACSFVAETGGLAAIGSISDTAALLRGEAGTIVTREAVGLELERVA